MSSKNAGHFSDQHFAGNNYRLVGLCVKVLTADAFVLKHRYEAALLRM